MSYRNVILILTLTIAVIISFFVYYSPNYTTEKENVEVDTRIVHLPNNLKKETKKTTYATVISITLKDIEIKINAITYYFTFDTHFDCLPLNFIEYGELSTNTWHHPIEYSVSGWESESFANFLLTKLDFLQAEIESKQLQLNPMLHDIPLLLYVHDIPQDMKSSFITPESQKILKKYLKTAIYRKDTTLQLLSQQDKALFYTIALQNGLKRNLATPFGGVVFGSSWKESLPHASDIYMQTAHETYNISVVEIGEESTFITTPRYVSLSRSNDLSIFYPFFAHIKENEILFTQIEFGVSSLRREYKKLLVTNHESEQYDDDNSSNTLVDPCLSQGAEYIDEIEGKSWVHNGTGSFLKCRDLIYQILSSSPSFDIFRRHFQANFHTTLSFKNAYFYSKLLDIKWRLDYTKLRNLVNFLFDQDWNSLRYMFPFLSEEYLKHILFELIFFGNIITMGPDVPKVYFAETFGEIDNVWELGAVLHEIRAVCITTAHPF